MEKIFEMPKEIYTNDPKLTILGFGEIIIENYLGILEYEENYIKLKTKIGNICIDGIKLILAELTEDNLRIMGKIISINLQK